MNTNSLRGLFSWVPVSNRSQQPQVGTPVAWKRDFSSLCPPHRGVIARLAGRPVPLDAALKAAALVQAQWKRGQGHAGQPSGERPANHPQGPTPSDEVIASEFLGKLKPFIGRSDRRLLVSNADQLFKNAGEVAAELIRSRNLTSALHALDERTLTTVISTALTSELTLPEHKLEERARIIYLAFVKQLAEHNEASAFAQVQAVVPEKVETYEQAQAQLASLSGGSGAQVERIRKVREMTLRAVELGLNELGAARPATLNEWLSQLDKAKKIERHLQTPGLWQDTEGQRAQIQSFRGKAMESLQKEAAKFSLATELPFPEQLATLAALDDLEAQLPADPTLDALKKVIGSGRHALKAAIASAVGGDLTQGTERGVPLQESVSRLERASHIAAQLEAAQGLPAQDVDTWRKALALSRSTVEAAALRSLPAQIDATTNGLTFSADLKQRLGQVELAERLLQTLRATPQAQIDAMLRPVLSARGTLQAIATHDRDLDALSAELGAQPPSKPGGKIQRVKLAQAFDQLKDAKAYAQRWQAMQRLLSTVGPGERQRVLNALCQAILPKAKATDRDHTYLLDLMDRGDAGLIDLVLAGHEWDDAAKLLKRGSAARAFDDAVAAIRADASSSESERGVALEDAAAAHQKKLLHLEVQHARRVVSSQLDSLFQMAAQRHRGFGFSFSALAAVPEAKNLPSHLFSAAKADDKLVNWLLANAGSVMKDQAELLVAEWIRLSLFDVETGEANAGMVDVLLSRLLAGSGNSPPFDEAAVRRHVAMGFKSRAEVGACRDHLLRFAEALGKTDALRKLEDDLFPHVKAARIVRSLTDKYGGHQPEAGPITQVMKKRLVTAAPWVNWYALEGQAVRVASNKASGAAAAMMGTIRKAWTTLKGDSQTALTGHAVKDYALASIREERQDRLQELFAGDLQGRGKGWLESKSGRTAVAATVRLAVEALRLHEQLTRKGGGPLSPSELERRAVLASQRDLAMERLKGLDLASFTVVKDSNNLPRDLYTDPYVQKDLQLLSKLIELDDMEDRLQMSPREMASALRDATQEALHLAVLQEIAEKGPHDASVRVSALRDGIMDRMKSYGFSDDPTLAQAREFIDTKLAEYEKLSFDELCTRWDTFGFQAQVFDAARKVARVLGSAEQKAKVEAEERRDRSAVLQRRIQELREGEAVTIEFGAFHSISIGLPGPIAIIGGALDSSHEKTNGITVALQDGKYTLSLNEGRTFKETVSMSFLASIVTKSIGKEQGSKSGYNFVFEDAASCSDLAAALSQGDPTHPALWGAKVERTAQESDKTTASLSAEAGIGLVFSSQLSAATGTQVSRTASGTRETITLEKSFVARADHTAELALGLGSLEHAIGVDFAARRTLETDLGVLRGTPEVVLAGTVVGDGLERALASVLPAQAKGSMGRLLAEIGEVPDGHEAVVEVRYRLKDTPQQDATTDLAKSVHHRALAAAAGPGDASRQMELQKQAVARANETLRNPDNYEACELSWTFRKRAAVEKDYQVEKVFARGESSKTRSTALPGGPVPVKSLP